MDESTAVHGFADRLPHRRALRRLYVWIALKTACPILLGLYIDATGGLLALAPAVALAPLEGLTFQIRIWRRYLRVFGVPPLSACRRMLQLDALRTYNARGVGTSPSRGSVLHLAAGFTGGAALFYAASWYTALVTPLYVATAALVIAVKAVIRRGRPPAVLLLGSSSARSSTLQMTVQKTVAPLIVTACLRHDSRSELLQQTFDFFSYRVSEADWRAVVTALVQCSPIVVVDARSVTGAVQFEVDLALREVARDRLFFVADSANHPELPADRCVTEGGLVETLDERLNRRFRKARTRRQTIFRDRQNGYFTFKPPAGWRLTRMKDPRTKVIFLHPAAPEVVLTIIVREAVGEDYASMLRSDQAATLQFTALGAACTTRETTMLGVPTFEVSAVLPDGQGFQMIRKFMAHDLQFNISYSAPTKRLFDRHASEVEASLNTIEVQVGRRSLARSRVQYAANRVRLGSLLASWRGTDEALKVLHDAATELPHDAEIRRTIDDLEEQRRNRVDT